MFDTTIDERILDCEERLWNSSVEYAFPSC